jgi:hypothetical protein
VKRLTKRADRLAAFLEATRLAGFTREEALKFFGPPEALPRAIDPFLKSWNAETAEKRYLERFEALFSSQAQIQSKNRALR